LIKNLSFKFSFKTETKTKVALIKNLSFKFNFKTETKTKVDDELFGGNSAKAEMRKKLGFLFLIF
jgi:hypothetical protein